MTTKLCCKKCGREKQEKEFFKMKSGDRIDICKECLLMHIQNDKPETFLWILEKFDIPYIEKKWVEIANKMYMKNPGKYGSPAHVPSLGTYVRSMNMTQYVDYCYADSDRLNFQDEKEKQELEAKRQQLADSEQERLLLEQLKNGEISEAEYNTRSFLTPSSFEMNETTTFLAPRVSIDENEITSNLTEEDLKYLAIKWGVMYKPSEWVKMEELYCNYESEYELNIDRAEILKKVCRVSLKMDQALDAGDMQSFKALSSTFDQLRKSGKFTESQKKEEVKRELDSIGELVKFVEREGGIIPQFEDPIVYPKDKIDFIIKDIQNYINNLVKDDLGLGNIIESYIEKMQKEKIETVEDIMNKGFDDKNEVLDEKDVAEFADFQASEIEKEAQALLDSFEEEGL